MDDIKTSKKLAYLLRHAPEDFDITLAEDGWASLARVARALKINTLTLRHIVDEDDKCRYQIDEKTLRIRALQGHSTDVGITFKPAVFDAASELYHGTPIANDNDIVAMGLKPGSRQFVHLTRDIDTARAVGRRRGTRAAIFDINFRKAMKMGVEFFESENSVILCKSVPPEALSILEFTKDETDAR